MNDLDHIERNQIEIMRALTALLLEVSLPSRTTIADALIERMDDTQAFLDLKMRPIQ